MVELHKRLVLNRFMLDLFGVASFHELARQVDSSANEGLDEDNTSKFHHVVANSANISRDILLSYDRNIVSHTSAISRNRTAPIRWKYFQYLALLFTEVYLDKYTDNSDELLAGLNEFCRNFNSELPDSTVSKFSKDDLRRLAFWSATGSGKTLIMHVNIKQYLHYCKKTGSSHKLNRILLVTTNEGLSRQHKEELDLSSIKADFFSKQGADLLSGKPVEIIEITKLKDTEGDKTVAIDYFEGNNLVLVDEGHRGSSGKEWSSRRKKLAQSGFTFEYSATLGQAASGNAELTDAYSKSILFDYSYYYFYGDGYGKDYKILNLADDSSDDSSDDGRELYLTACLLSFYQQKVRFQEPQSEARAFNVEAPLLVFVGGSVTKSTKSKDISDIIDILLFFARFSAAANKKQVLQHIKRATSTDTGLLDKPTGRDIFANAFPAFADRKPTDIYDGIIKHIFNASTSGLLHVEQLKGTAGEIALRLGANNDPFGVINVGDADTLCKLCRDKPGLEVTERHFTGSLFHNINRDDSSINVLIGSRKFSEGWNSWRVSTMGLMNIGRSEGTQIIQLFGRGVRLKGKGNSLKRHSAMLGERSNEKLKQLETLNIFGIRADYMEQFRKYLEKEGVPTGGNDEETIIPTITNLGKQKLKTIRLKEGLNFKKDGGKSVLAWCDNIKVAIDYYPRIQAKIAEGLQIGEAEVNQYGKSFSSKHLEFIDIDAIYFDLQKFKSEKEWFNFSISKEQIKKILMDKTWYEIYIPHELWRFDSFDKVSLWQDMATSLLRKYCARFYNHDRNEWESGHREYCNIDSDDTNFIKEFKVLIDKSQTQVITQLNKIRDAIKKGSLPSADQTFGQAGAIFFPQHLYQPLLYAGSDDIKIIPAVLNRGEKNFVEDLRRHYQSKPDSFSGKKLYLLRNMSKGRGVGFFEANNFHPDFIMWLLDGNKQYISFVDPKGISRYVPDDLKLKFYKNIKEIEKQLGDKNVALNSFIISVTPFHEVPDIHNASSPDDFMQKHILFQEKDGYIQQLFDLMQT